MRIKKLKAKSVRGLPRSWPELEVGDKGLVVYGPNGVGKSSIIDALEFALTQRSTLFSENRMGVSWEAAAPHVTDDAPDIIVEAVEGSSTYEVAPGRSSDGNTELDQWLQLIGTCHSLSGPAHPATVRSSNVGYQLVRAQHVRERRRSTFDIFCRA